jgi:hypothetical protein
MGDHVFGAVRLIAVGGARRDLEVVGDKFFQIEAGGVLLRLIVRNDLGRLSLRDAIHEGLPIGKDPVHLDVHEQFPIDLIGRGADNGLSKRKKGGDYKK